MSSLARRSPYLSGRARAPSALRAPAFRSYTYHRLFMHKGKCRREEWVRGRDSGKDRRLSERSGVFRYRQAPVMCCACPKRQKRQSSFSGRWVPQAFSALGRHWHMFRSISNIVATPAAFMPPISTVSPLKSASLPDDALDSGVKKVAQELI